MPVIGVLAETDVARDQQPGNGTLDRAGRELYRALRVPGTGSLLVLSPGTNRSTPPSPSAAASCASATAAVTDRRSTPGIASIGSRAGAPSALVTNRGSTSRSAVTSVSRTAP